jgi:hypothetical protein
MEQKIFTAPLELKADGDGQPGEFKAVFATFNVADHQRDWTVPGAFKDGQEAIIESWNHGETLPVGKGVIHSNGKEAWVEGKFFLDTEVGRDHHATVKNLGPLAQWSYTFDIEKATIADPSKHPGAERVLRALNVVGFSGVTRGAGINTRTVAIKSDDDKTDGEKPYPNEHACRLRKPGDFQPNSFRRTTRESDGKKYSIIIGKLKGEETTTEQAYRYNKDTWTVSEARSHCNSHDGSFEAAANEGEASDAGKSSVDIDILTKIDIIEACVIASIQE